MKKKLSKSLLRLKKNFPKLRNEVLNSDNKKLSSSQVAVFKSLQDKYDLSLLSQSSTSKNLKDESELSEGAKISLLRIKEGVKKLADDEWDGWAPNALLGHRVHGKRLGILGMGRIGQAIAKRAKAFGIQIHYHNRHRLPIKLEEGLEATYWESLDQMLARVDFLSINAPPNQDSIFQFGKVVPKTSESFQIILCLLVYR